MNNETNNKTDKHTVSRENIDKILKAYSIAIIVMQQILERSQSIKDQANKKDLSTRINEVEIDINSMASRLSDINTAITQFIFSNMIEE